ncbi:uncharacterized protein LOC129309161 isoform X2 [Prosopis cineraria]|uniref:uncharacterized protein LOC129309161 isoform X2 n=1 Tax=Prosopis cineraria TaxID=364024 RepID=UPI00240FD130|nr:uncharacterized protein LOC129309161 isoform X2 [Prosopis cineraria]
MSPKKSILPISFLCSSKVIAFFSPTISVRRRLMKLRSDLAFGFNNLPVLSMDQLFLSGIDLAIPTEAFVVDLADLAIEFRELCFTERSISRCALLKGVFLCLEFGLSTLIEGNFDLKDLFEVAIVGPLRSDDNVDTVYVLVALWISGSMILFILALIISLSMILIMMSFSFITQNAGLVGSIFGPLMVLLKCFWMKKSNGKTSHVNWKKHAKLGPKSRLSSLLEVFF